MAGEKDKFSEQQIGEATKALYAAMIKPREPSTVSERQPTSLSETITPVSIRVNASGDNIEAIVSNFATAANKIIDANKNVVTPVSRSIAAPVNIIDLRGYSVNSPNYTSLVSRNFNALRGKVDNLGYELSKKVSEVRKLETAIRARESNLITAQMTMAKNLSKNVEGHVSKLKEEIRDLQKQLQFRRRQDSDQNSQDKVEERAYQRSRYDDEEEEGRGRGRRHGFGLGAIAGIGSRFRGVTKVAEAAGEVLGAASLAGIGYFLIKSGIGEKIVTQVLPNVLKAVEPLIEKKIKQEASSAWDWIKADLKGDHRQMMDRVNSIQKTVENYVKEAIKNHPLIATGVGGLVGGPVGAGLTSAYALYARQSDPKLHADDLKAMEDAQRKARHGRPEVEPLLGKFDMKSWWEGREVAGKDHPARAPSRREAFFDSKSHKDDPMKSKLEAMIAGYKKEGVTPPKHIVDQLNALNAESLRNKQYAGGMAVPLPPVTIDQNSKISHKGLDRFYDTKNVIERNQRLKRSAINMMVPGTTFGSPASTLNGDDMDGPLSFKNWIEGPTPWGNVIPDIAGAMGGNANSRAGGGGGYFNTRGGGGATGPVPITKPEVPTLPKINTGPGHVVSANPLSPGKIDSTQLFKSYVAEFSKSKLNGYIPKDGAKFGITTGKPEEWARFALAESMQESGLNSYASNGGLNQFNTGDLRRYHVTGNVNDPNAQVKALVNQFSSSIPKAGFIRGPNNTGAAAYFGPVRRSSFDASFNSTSELSKHYKAANEVYTNVGDMTGQKSFAMSPSSAKVFGVSSRNKQFVDMIESYRNQNKAYAEQSGGDNMSYMAGDTRGQNAFGQSRTYKPTMTQVGNYPMPKIGSAQWNYQQSHGVNPAGREAQSELTIVPTAFGKLKLNKNAAVAWQGWTKDMKEAGAPISHFGTYNLRKMRRGNAWSSHSFGFAGDVDDREHFTKQQKEWFSAHRDQVMAIDSKWGFKWNPYEHNNPVSGDEPHFEFGGAISQEAANELASSNNPKALRVLKGAYYLKHRREGRLAEYPLKTNTIAQSDPGIHLYKPGAELDPTKPEFISKARMDAATQKATVTTLERDRAQRGGAYLGGGIVDQREARKLETMPGLKMYNSLNHPSVLSQVQSQVSDIHQSTAAKNLHTQLDVNGAIRSKGSDLAPKAKPKSPVSDPKAGGYHDKNAQTNINGAIRDRVKPAGGTQNAKQDVRMPRSDSADTSPAGPGENGTGAADSICFV